MQTIDQKSCEVRQANRGLLLIVMVGILTLLLMVSVAFVSLARLERRHSASGLDSLRAKLLARSGVEYALARLLENPESEGSPEDDWRYRDEPTVSLEKSLNPSYKAGEPWDDTATSNGRFDPGSDAWNPVTQDWNGNGKYDAWSGRLRGTSGVYSDRFKLRIEDPAGKIAINGDGTPAEGDEYVDSNGNGRWDPEEFFADISHYVANGTGPHEWYAYGWGEDVKGEEEPPDEKWYPGEKYEDWNGNGRRDLVAYRDLNGDGIWQPGDEPVEDDQSRKINSPLEAYENGERTGDDVSMNVKSDNAFMIAGNWKDNADGLVGNNTGEENTEKWEAFADGQERSGKGTVKNNAKYATGADLEQMENDIGMTDEFSRENTEGSAAPPPPVSTNLKDRSEDDDVDRSIDDVDEETGEGEQTKVQYGPKIYKEPYVDSIRNGYYDPPEPLTDRNGNGMWDPAERLTLDWNRNGRYDPPLLEERSGLITLLDALGDLLKLERGLGKRVLSGRPYTSFESLRRALSPAEFDRIRPYVTLFGRPDPSTIRPHPVDLKVGDPVLYQAQMNRLDPVVWEARVPVSANDAREEVLKALFLPLQAKYLSRGCDTTSVPNVGEIGHRIGTVKKAEIRGEAVEYLVENVLQYRKLEGVFSSHRQWEAFVDILSFSGKEIRPLSLPSAPSDLSLHALQNAVVGNAARAIPKEKLSTLEASLIKANSNSNVRLNKFNPEDHLHLPIDKADLTFYTTELTFDPSGIFEVVSLGELHSSGARTSAVRLETVYALWDVWKDTTQADFSSGKVSLNTDPLAAPSYENRSLQTYPEPEAGGRGPFGWDGYVSLATLRSEILPQDGLEAGFLPPGFQAGWLSDGNVDPDLLFCARYEDSLDADYSKYGGDRKSYPETPSWHPGWPDGPSGRPNENGVGNPNNPGSLYPDGAFADFRNIPAYDMEKHFQVHLTAPSKKVYNSDGSWTGKRLQVREQEVLGQEEPEQVPEWEGEDEGTIAFWFKHAGVSGYHRLFSFSYSPRNSNNTHWSWRFQMGWEKGGPMGFHYEPDDDGVPPHSVDDEANPRNERTGGEWIAAFQKTPETGQWAFVVAGWNQSFMDPEGSIQLWYNGTRSDSNGVVGDIAYYPAPAVIPFQRLFRLEDGVNRKRFRLGEFSRPGWDVVSSSQFAERGTHSPACSTIDEFCIYEKDKVQIATGETGFAVTGYQMGRYYRWNDAVYTSRPREPGNGSRILQMSWTSRTPPSETERHRILLDVNTGSGWLLDADGDGRLSEAEELRAIRNGWTDEGGVTLPDGSVSGRVHYRAYFRNDVPPFGVPILASPVLDDVTIAYAPPDGPVSLQYWED